MAYNFNDYVRMLPGQGIATNANRMALDGNDPATFVPGYQSGLETLNNIGIIGTAGAVGAYPVVLNNLQYAEPYMDYVGGLQDYNRALGNINNYATGLQMLDPVYGAQNFAYAVSPGTMAGTGITYGVANANPYLGLGMGINNITANEANPYGAIPGFSHLGEFTNSVTNTLNNTPFATGVRNIASDVYNSTLGRVMDNDVGRNIHNLASMPMNALSGTTNLLREGYQALDRNVFGNLLPGGADSGDAESLRFDNPYANLQENIKKIGERKDEILYDGLYEKFNDVEQQLATRFEEKGFSKKEIVDIINDPAGGALQTIQDLKVEGNPDFGGLTKDEMNRVTQLLNEETKVFFKDGSDLPEATITPDFKIEGITQADLDALDARDREVFNNLDLVGSGVIADLDRELTSQSIDTIKNQLGMGTNYEQMAQDALNEVNANINETAQDVLARQRELQRQAEISSIARQNQDLMNNFGRGGINFNPTPGVTTSQTGGGTFAGNYMVFPGPRPTPIRIGG